MFHRGNDLYPYLVAVLRINALRVEHDLGLIEYLAQLLQLPLVNGEKIGIRKAVGATRREIQWQFLTEASLLTATGAAAGLLIGWGISELLAYYTPLPARIPLWSVLAAITLAALTGILFGMIPALRAAKLDPVDALRYE